MFITRTVDELHWLVFKNWFGYVYVALPKNVKAILIIDIESLQNRLLKFCYVPATSASLPRVSFFFSFLFFVAAAIDSTNEANKVPLSSLYS